MHSDKSLEAKPEKQHFILFNFNDGGKNPHISNEREVFEPFLFDVVSNSYVSTTIQQKRVTENSFLVC